MAEQDQLQLVTFQLGNEIYGVDIFDVREIQRRQEVRPIPNAPPFIEGIFKLRRDIIPVINLHRRFHIPEPELSEEDRLLSGILILEIDRNKIGVLIDKVLRVVSIPHEKVQPPPEVFTGIGTEYIEGVVQQEDGYLIVLDVHRLFSPKELRQIERTIAR
ncbi:CheW protein [Spirochaeta thermophila DSM 6578]|uniref:CheW protein n=1 Tax=Winmispira thermophila (strain ATCC 700085 / DSM 6578 / Z-1203) TaxID=869211 RepID=G0GC94_WINT7|nr:chemotaxis protein CheW [Spirochaeta thermophila]AEJ61179.1 CheW protein [Spirochaeta thermophila DSM 6578]